ncbi:MAG: toll/interleukin-1 receptor domain-containing protein, partial [Pseudomonadota bacterium]
MSRKKVFLSHRGSDQAVADEVAAILCDLGHHVFDMKDWKPGAPFVAEMNRSLKEADHMIALASASYWESGMCQLEIEVAMRMHREERPGFLLTYRIEDHTVEPAYSATAWGDFTNGVDRATLERWFGTGEPEIKTAVSLMPVPTRHFFGREEMVEQLHDTILRANAASVQAVAGGAGIGKTTLALHYANLESVAARFPIRWQVNAETLPDGAKTPSTDGLDSGLAGLGRALGVAQAQEPDAVAAQKTLAWLRAEPRDALILFDNADDGALLAPYLPEGTATILVTTRIDGMAGLPSLSLDRWDEETAARFLMDRSGDTDEDAAKALAQALDGLPLACEQAAAYAQGARISLAAYLDLFEQNPGAMLD